MSGIYEQVRALAVGDDCDEEAIREWLSENSGESSMSGIWVSNANLKSIDEWIAGELEWCLDWLEDTQGFTAERAEQLRAKASLTNAELCHLRNLYIQQKAEDHELDCGQYVSLVEFRKNRRKSVWLLYTSSGGGWGVVEREIFDAFFSAEDAIASLKEDGYTDL